MARLQKLKRSSVHSHAAGGDGLVLGEQTKTQYVGSFLKEILLPKSDRDVIDFKKKASKMKQNEIIPGERGKEENIVNF